jgi:hypothetical protein
MPVLAPFSLAQSPHSTRDSLRQNLEDALKRYSDLDLLVEVLQNALDAIDLKRYRLICGVLGRDPEAGDTIDKWNQAVVASLKSDHEAYNKAETTIDRAQLYRNWHNDRARRDAWWAAVAEAFEFDKAQLIPAVGTLPSAPSLKISLDRRAAPVCWLEVLDNGVGISKILHAFMHQFSTKRPSPDRVRRLGIRGSQGWGLTAVLAMSDSVQVVSRTAGEPPHGYQFSQYASFARGTTNQPQNDELDLADPAIAKLFDKGLLGKADETGTHIRIRIDRPGEGNLLGHTLLHFSDAKFVNLLRLYTPVGQVNDYVLHPAYHCVRKGDLSVSLIVTSSTGNTTRSIAFDTFRIDENQAAFGCYSFDQFVNAGMPEKVSVHTVHRARFGDDVYLSAAEIQDTDLIREVERTLVASDALPGLRDATESDVAQIPRGLQLALSGGMRSEYMAREPKGNMAMFRGVVLAETAHPTLGRKHVLDQRTAIAKAAARHESHYDDVRKRVVVKSVVTQQSPAGHKWKREQIDGVVRDLKAGPPPSPALSVWAVTGSKEAKVMMLFAELLGRGTFGDFRILRANHKDRYDFTYLYTADLTAPGARPSVGNANDLDKKGYGKHDKKGRRYYCYGIGEFKDRGHELFNDFNPDTPSKAPEALDLLVCWEFDPESVAEKNWSVEGATGVNADYPGQTHLWKPTQAATFTRTRPLPVVALSALLAQLIATNKLPPLPQNWGAGLPAVYY